MIQSMSITVSVFEILLTYLGSPLDSHVIHIAGPNASGKSTFILEFLEFLVPKLPPTNVYYLDTEQKFKTAKYQENPVLQKIKYASISTIVDLNKRIELWLNNSVVLNKGDIIIIDSLSELCKVVLSKTDSWREYFSENKELYHTLFAPLIRVIRLKQAWVIFTHHAVYSPALQGCTPAFKDFAYMIEGLWVLMTINSVQEHQKNQTSSSWYDVSSPRMLELFFEFKKREGNKTTSKIFSRKYLYQIADKIEILEEIISSVIDPC